MKSIHMPRLKEWHLWIVIFLSFGAFVYSVYQFCHGISHLLEFTFN